MRHDFRWHSGRRGDTLSAFFLPPGIALCPSPEKHGARLVASVHSATLGPCRLRHRGSARPLESSASSAEVSTKPMSVTASISAATSSHAGSVGTRTTLFGALSSARPWAASLCRQRQQRRPGQQYHHGHPDSGARSKPTRGFSAGSAISTSGPRTGARILVWAIGISRCPV